MRKKKQPDAAPVTEGDVIATLRRFVDNGRRAQHVADHLIAYGPGLTFGELAVGDLFVFADPLEYRGASVRRLQTRPHQKVAVDRYETYLDAQGRPNGTGTAEDYYRVERWREDPE